MVATSTPPATGPAPSARSDAREWLDALAATGPARDQAVAALYELLLRAARFTVSRRPGTPAGVRGEELDDLAVQAADDALVAVLGKLGHFRGESRFTTWAYKFAVLEAGVRMRRRAWHDREVVLDSDSWRRLAPAGPGPDADAETAELVRAVAQCIEGDLSERQRQVLVALAIDGVPIDVLAERLGTNRNALYKTLHDARRKLRSALAARGLRVDTIEE